MSRRLDTRLAEASRKVKPIRRGGPIGAILDAAAVPRFFLDRDSSAHWYLVPEAQRQAWIDWGELDEDDEASWELPEALVQAGCRRLSGAPSGISFTDPRDDYGCPACGEPVEPETAHHCGTKK